MYIGIVLCIFELYCVYWNRIVYIGIALCILELYRVCYNCIVYIVSLNSVFSDIEISNSGRLPEVKKKAIEILNNQR